ncbi:MAG: hypothetical protein JNN15_07740 [Blastocatellia bacterium]|nr:hypothetical protein [Blastocatellia bacterium]
MKKNLEPTVMKAEKADCINIWECKECNTLIQESDSVAFHLVNGFLYGWCRKCFENRSQKKAQKN